MVVPQRWWQRRRSVVVAAVVVAVLLAVGLLLVVVDRDGADPDRAPAAGGDPGATAPGGAGSEGSEGSGGAGPEAGTSGQEGLTVGSVVSGDGDDSVLVTAADDAPSLLRITHAGSGGFAVTSHGADGDPIEVLVDTAGAYEGVRPANFPTSPAVARLEISASGPWTVGLLPLSDVTTFESDGTPDGGSVTGTGDDVVMLPGIASLRVTMTHRGPGPITASGWGSEGRVPMVEQPGPFERQLRTPAGALFLEVVAEGEWRISLGWD